MNETSQNHRVLGWRNIVIAIVLLLGILYANWVKSKEASALEQLEVRSTTLETDKLDLEKLRTTVYNAPILGPWHADHLQWNLNSTIAAFDGSMRAELPEQLWQDDLPLIFLNNNDSTTQIYLGNFDSDLLVTIEKASSSQPQDSNPLVNEVFNLKKNSWQFFDLRVSTEQEPSVLNYGLSNREQTTDLQELALEFDNCIITVDDEVSGIQHFEDFDAGRMTRVLCRKKVIRVGGDGGSFYLITLKLVL